VGVRARFGIVAGAVVLALVAVVVQVVDDRLVQPRIEGASMPVGAFLTVVPGIAGFRIYGAGGALVAFVLTLLVVSVAVDRGESRGGERPSAGDGPVVPGPAVSPTRPGAGDPAV